MRIVIRRVGPGRTQLDQAEVEQRTEAQRRIERRRGCARRARAVSTSPAASAAVPAL